MNIWEEIFKGIRDERRAFCGPHTVQIDLTDKCNNSCIACWVHSPLLDEKEIFPRGKKELPFGMIQQLIHQLHSLGTTEIILSGSGEPFVYPHIREVIRLIKERGMYLNIITNVSLLNKDTIRLLVDSKVNLITASIWAGTPNAYVSTHPGRDEKDFELLKENLKDLARYKDEKGVLLPHVKVYNVLCSKNYDDIEAMVDFAREVDAGFIEFQLVDGIKGKTDALLLDTSLQKKVIESFNRISRRRDLVKWQKGTLKDTSEVKDEDFGKIWKNFRADFVLLDKAENIMCPKGKLCKKGEQVDVLFPPGQVQQPSFRFLFDEGMCKVCQSLTRCFPSQECAVDVRLLNFLGIETFIRRLSSPEVESGMYEKHVNSLPCYIGWYYVRVLTSGDVIPCCKAYLHPLGNLHKDSFSKIWESSSYRDFRFKAKRLSKIDPYFSRINCIKSCDNWGMNVEIHERLKLALCEKKEDTEQATKKENVILAKDFIKGNLNPGHHDFGKGLIIDGGHKTAFAYYRFSLDEGGLYELWTRYASGLLRPVDIYIDKKLVKKGGLSGISGGWTPKFLKWYKELTIELKKGTHSLEIRSSNCIPHIEKFMFCKKEDPPDFLKEQGDDSRFNTIYKHIHKNGMARTFKRASYYLTPRNLKDRYLEGLGIFDGEYGYKGPFHVQIDLTNNCNNKCIACWCNSPLLKEKRLSSEEKKQYLPLSLVKELLDETSSTGATEVYYSGSGEPFMHPQIMKVLEYTKKKDLICHVNTNFTLLDQERLDCLIDIGVDFVTVSTWAATAETYARTHPYRTKEDFWRIRENLLYLNEHKKDKPRIKLYNVLFNMNYFEVEEMIEFAHETRSESLEFTLIDTMPGSTDILVLNKDQLAELKESLARIKPNLDENNKVKDTGVLVFQFDQFLRRIYVDEDVQDARYDRNIIDSMPCYIGWLFARIIPNGEVHSCLKSHRIPTGSLYRDRFLEIWNSKKQSHFRKKTLVCKKSDPFFKYIGNDANIEEAGCYKSCDDIGRNTWMHSRIKLLTMPERLVLKGTAKTLKIARKIRPERNGHKRFHEDPLIAGISHGRKAFVGPEHIVIDPTNKCNLRCISCWIHSPLLTDDKPSPDFLRKELPKEALIGLIDDLSFLGTKRIRFTGGGDPFMHKDLMAIIEHARKKQLLVALTTNFSMVSKKDIKALVDLGLEELCISIWGSNLKTYRVLHPGAPDVYFERLKDNLLYLKEIKKDRPRVTFANVITNSNVKDFPDMYKFGLSEGADAIYFTLVDVFRGQTDKLLLNKQDKKDLLTMALEVKERNKKDNVQLEFFEGFLKRISSPEQDFEKGEYDRMDIDKIPCYVGWFFCRILADGDVVPCCRGVKKLMGNINENSFKDIWFSSRYNEFRAKAKYLSKRDHYFKEIGCIKECDNLMHNEEMHGRVWPNVSKEESRLKT